MNALISGTAGALTLTLESLSIQVPEDIQTTLAMRERIQNYTPNVNLAQALYTSLKEERDPTTDPDFTKAVMASQATLTGVITNALDYADVELAQAIESSTPTIYKDLARIFTKETKALTEAKRTLGDVDLENGGGMLNQTPEGAQAWARALQAEAHLQKIRASRNILGRLANKTQINFAAAFLNDIPTSHERSQNRFWDLAHYVVHEGMTWSLNTHEQEQQIIQHSTAQRLAQAEKRAAEQRSNTSYLRYI